MSTGSIRHNIEITDSADAERFVEALEKAKAESEEGMERLIEIKTHVTGFCYADKKEGIFAQNVYAKLAAYEDTGLTPKQIQEQQRYIKALEKQVEVEGQQAIIEAQQQEIEQLKDQNDTLAATVNMFAPYIIGKKESEVVEELKELLTLKHQNQALTKDKDEQAGRLMKMDYLLRRTLPILEVANDQQGLIDAINALLGGKEDEK